MKNSYLNLRGSGSKKITVPNFLSGFDTSVDGGVLSADKAQKIENFSYKNGALTKSYGFNFCGIEASDITNIWQYVRYNDVLDIEETFIMYSSSSGEIFAKNESVVSFLKVAGVTFTSTPEAAQYRLYGKDVLLLMSKTDGMAVWDGENPLEKIEDSPKITSFTLHYERMFATDETNKNAVWFSDDLDPTNWECDINSGGFIEMLDQRGKPLKVVSFLSYVYIFREYGISRLTAYADQTDFLLSNLFTSAGKIFKDTVTLCGNTIIFLSTDGLYKFDGLSTTKIAPKTENLNLFKGSPFAVFCNGKYFLTYCDSYRNESDFNSDNNTVLVFDIKSGVIELVKPINAKRLACFNDELYAVLASGEVLKLDDSGKVLNEPLKKVYQSGEWDFGTDKVKTLKSFSVVTNEEITLTIKSERAEKSFNITPSSNGVSFINPMISGRLFEFVIASNTENPRILKPSAVVTVHG